MRSLKTTGVCGVLLALCSVSCGGSSRSELPNLAEPASQRPAAARASSDKPLVLVDGVPIDAAAFDGRLHEAAGAVVLEEFVLDQKLSAACRDAGISIDKSKIDAERALLLANIGADAGVSEDQAGAMIDRFRKARGLGPGRYAALLARNASLRALVRQNGLVDDAAVNIGVTQELSAKVLARIFVAQNDRTASEALAELQAIPQGPARSARFSAMAFQSSRDPSSQRGGLFGPVDPTDPTLPSIIRTALSGSPGTLSSLLALDSGFGFVLIEDQIAARPMPSGAELELVREKVRTRKEREAMDTLAANLTAAARVTVIDEPLRWSWDARPRR
ncbi:MAG: hypothetical protein JSR77_09165 [Planctomycetes bacterium]|nr:hypothetical protein [Planctomycetota bacterium]